jgi:hypothetical protein
MTPDVQDYPLAVARNYFGLSDIEIIEMINLKIEMFNIRHNSHVPRLDEGFNKGFRLRSLKIISPGILERSIVGLLWAIGAGIISVLAVSVSTRGVPRTFRWLRNGFTEEEPVRYKRRLNELKR